MNTKCVSCSVAQFTPSENQNSTVCECNTVWVPRAPPKFFHCRQTSSASFHDRVTQSSSDFRFFVMVVVVCHEVVTCWSESESDPRKRVNSTAVLAPHAALPRDGGYAIRPQVALLCCVTIQVPHRCATITTICSLRQVGVMLCNTRRFNIFKMKVEEDYLLARSKNSNWKIAKTHVVLDFWNPETAKSMHRGKHSHLQLDGNER